MKIAASIVRILALWVSICSTAQAFVPSMSKLVEGGRSSSVVPTTFVSGDHVGNRDGKMRLQDLTIAASEALGSSTTGMNPLTQYLLETLISNGVPAIFSLIVIAFAAKAFSGGRGKMDEDSLLETENPVAELYDDLYGDQDQSGRRRRGGFGGFGPPNNKKKLPKNAGVPLAQYLKVTDLSRKYDSYDYSLNLATKSKAAAAASYRKTSFARAVDKALANDLPASVWAELQKAESEFLKEGIELSQELQVLQTKLTQQAVDDELKGMGLDTAYPLDPATNETAVDSNTTSTEDSSKKKKSSTGSEMKKCADLTMKLQALELDFIKEVVSIVGPVRGPSFRAALLGDVAARGSGNLLMALQDRPITALLSGGTSQTAPPSVFMCRFPGDTTASQVENLREEVTAIVRAAKPGDEALLILQTGGGTVTGYGLAAAQLLRLKEAGLKLVIAVEQVAASGGYMMCCTADKIIASPFAVLGSIGVITDIPNVYDRLKTEGITFQTVTAGKYKRTLTPTKKVTKEDFDKTKEDVEEILTLFRDFVAQNRPQLDIDKVATGETWFGDAALERKLCDEIKTVDAVIMDYVNAGSRVYEIEYSPPLSAGPFGKILEPASSSNTALSFPGEDESSGGLVRQGVRWLVRTLMQEVKAATVDATSEMLNQPVQERYRAQDDTSQRFKAQD